MIELEKSNTSLALDIALNNFIIFLSIVKLHSLNVHSYATCTLCGWGRCYAVPVGFLGLNGVTLIHICI